MKNDKKISVSEDISVKAVAQVTQTRFNYRTMCSRRRRQLVSLYQEVMSYEAVKQADWSSALKVNFANQIEQLVTSRLTAKNPKFIVSLRIPPEEIADKLYPKPAIVEKIDKAQESGQPYQPLPEEMQVYQQWKDERRKLEDEIQVWSKNVQEYLDFVFGDAYDFSATVRRIAKALVRYGNCYATVDWKVKNYRAKVGGKIVEKQYAEYPCLENISYSEIYLDPRFIQVCEAPAVIRNHENVRLNELYALQESNNLFNLDKIKQTGQGLGDFDKYLMYTIMITSPNGVDTEQTFKSLTVSKYYGYFSDTDEPEGEKLYELWVVNDAVLIKKEEITEIPIFSAGCFEDVEQHFSIGYVEPILGLQREYNFKLNSAVEYINHALNRAWFWDPQCGIDPKSLNAGSAPNAIIPVTKGIQAAKEGLLQIENREINQSYFAQNNEVRRDMQSVSFTIDTNQTSTSQGFTNTATAVRARFYEINTVYADTLRHFEELLTRLAYSVLEKVSQHASNDIYIPHTGKKLAPELFSEAMLRYMVRVEVGSSSFDTLESRREDALALWNLSKDFKMAGGSPDLNRVWEEVLSTFEKRNPDDYVKHDMTPLMAQMGIPTPQQLTPTAPVTTGTPGLNNVPALTKAVVQDNLPT